MIPCFGSGDYTDFWLDLLQKENPAVPVRGIQTKTT